MLIVRRICFWNQGVHQVLMGVKVRNDATTAVQYNSSITYTLHSLHKKYIHVVDG